ncbi:MAG: alpha/beta fold hydrolase [Megasphaera sp.]|jgi:dienelactone hydrolase|nr:alpha/beta fold hydrolase [Megasphaera sp.]MCH4188379.1 alpha/beta fold hydrolase [Megasphaera sp.]MCH4218218.1 alpha/beta fold hydrolase [Megasphaera sp.]
MIEERNVNVEGIPCLRLTCGGAPKGVVLFYHGWTSTKELQSVRGHLLAAYGYDVLIPDAVNHGERGPIDYETEGAYPEFWQTIFQNIREAPALIDYIRTCYKETPVAVMGHSMGGFTALGVMTHCSECKTAVAINGSGWWDESERRFRASLHIAKPDGYKTLMMQIAAMDPYDYTQRLAGRSVLALNGGADTVVDNAAETMYMEKVLKESKVDSKFITYDETGHFVTTNMMGDAIDWLNHQL